MPGFDQERFVDLPSHCVEAYTCNICHKILNNAVFSECQHNFCKECITKYIEKDNGDNCPRCQTKFPSKWETPNSLIIRDFIFKNNFVFNKSIKQLKMKCEFEVNGCEDQIPCRRMDYHLRYCEHWLCPTCGLKRGVRMWWGIFPHDCLVSLKTELCKLNRERDEVNTNKASFKSALEQLAQVRLELESQKVDHASLNEQVSQLKKRNKILESDKVGLKVQLIKSNTTVNELKTMQDKLNEVQKLANNKIERQVESLNEQVNLLKKSEELLIKVTGHFEAKKEQLEDKVDKLNLEVESLNEQVQLFKENEVKLKNDNVQIKKEKDDLEQSQKELVQRVNELKQKKKEWKRKFITLSENERHTYKELLVEFSSLLVGSRRKDNTQASNSLSPTFDATVEQEDVDLYLGSVRSDQEDYYWLPCAPGPLNNQNRSQGIDQERAEFVHESEQSQMDDQTSSSCSQNSNDITDQEELNSLPESK